MHTQCNNIGKQCSEHNVADSLMLHGTVISGFGAMLYSEGDVNAHAQALQGAESTEPLPNLCRRMAHANADAGQQTLFVAGLPDDVRPREVFMLFGRCPGYVRAVLKYPPGMQPAAFVTFADHLAALGAMHSLQVCDSRVGGLEMHNLGSAAAKSTGLTV